MDSSKEDVNSSIITLGKSTDNFTFKTEISIKETQKDQDIKCDKKISPNKAGSRTHRLRRRSSVNFGSPLPTPKSCAEIFYDIKFPLG